MNRDLTRLALSASALALGLGLAPAAPLFAQDAAQPPAEAAPVNEGAAVANDNQPITAPETEASRANVMPQTFADLVDLVGPAVVNITTSSVVAAPVGPMFPEGSPFGDLFRDFGFPQQQMPDGRNQRQQRSNALGSGFVISADGFIVTNNHVIEGADEIEIEFRDGARRQATVIGTDPQTDIALLKVEAEDLPYVGFGDSETARVGDWVLAVGNPLGQGFSASTGIVSARGRALQGTYDDYIQTDASINRGNSGGPLFNMDGEVIGVNTAILSPSGGSIGIGFSMASNVVTQVVEQLREYGETRRGWLGVRIQDMTPEIAESLGLQVARGALVNDVPEGPAADAGMRAGDVILSFAGREITDTRDLVRRVAEAPYGQPVSLEVLRGGEVISLDVTLGRRELAEAGGDGRSPADGPAETSPGAQDLLGMTLQPLTADLAEELGVPPSTQGLVVRAVDAAGVAAERGVGMGDIITEVGQRPVSSIADFNDRIAEARERGWKSVLLLVRRSGEPRFVALPISD